MLTIATRIRAFVHRQIEAWHETERIYDVLAHPEKHLRELESLEARYRLLSEEYSKYAEKDCERRQGSQIRN